jgi:hypothetical protein
MPTFSKRSSFPTLNLISFSNFLFGHWDESWAPISRSSRLFASQNLDHVREGPSSHCVWMEVIGAAFPYRPRSPYCVSPNPCNRSSCSLRWSPKENRKVCATISWTFGPSRSMTAADWPYLRLPCRGEWSKAGQFSFFRISPNIIAQFFFFFTFLCISHLKVPPIFFI